MRVTQDAVADAQAILNIAKQYKLENADMLFDLYCVFKSGGQALTGGEAVLSELQKKDPVGYWEERSKFYHSRVTLGNVARSKTFDRLKSLPPLVAIDGVAKLIATATKARWLFNKTDVPRQEGHFYAGHKTHAMAISLSAALERSAGNLRWVQPKELETHLQNLAGGSAINDNVISMEDVLCTLDGVIEALDNPAFQAIADAAHNSAQGYYLGATGHSRGLWGSALGAAEESKIAGLIITVAQSLAATGAFILFDIIRNVGEKAGFETKSQVITDAVTNHTSEDTMHMIGEVIDAHPADISREDFEKRVIDRSLEVTKHTGQEATKAHCFVLFDKSGSMHATDTAISRLDRYGYCMAILFAMLDKVIARGDVLHIIPFCGVPGEVITVDSPEKVYDAVDAFIKSTPNGGTCIPAAVRAAYAKIATYERYRRCDIVILSDADDTFKPKALRDEAPHGTRMIAIHVGDGVADAERVCMSKLVDPGKFIVGEWDDKNNMPLLRSVLDGI